MIVFVEDTFDSAHWLPNVPDGHKCKNLHGHTYRVRIEIDGPIGDQSGWVMDYTEIKEKWQRVKGTLDHRCLNDIPALQNSTCENLTNFLWTKLQDEGLPLHRLEVRETANSGVIKTA